MFPAVAIVRFKQYAGPLAVFLVLAVAFLVAPLLPLEERSVGYLMTALAVVVGFGAALPYAALVAVGTLPLLSAGVASFAAPDPQARVAHSFSDDTAIRHFTAGLYYGIGASILSFIGFGVDIVRKDMSRAALEAVHPLFMPLYGSVIVAVIFVWFQLWRYDAPLDAIPRRTVVGTTVLGVLLALSPAAAFWVFIVGS